MMFHLYAFKNRLLGQFDRPVAEIVDPKDYLENISLALVASDAAALNRTKEFDVYYLGTVDNKSGEVKHCCEYVGSLEPVCIRILEHREKKDVGDSEAKA